MCNIMRTLNIADPCAAVHLCAVIQREVSRQLIMLLICK